MGWPGRSHPISPDSHTSSGFQGADCSRSQQQSNKRAEHHLRGTSRGRGCPELWRYPLGSPQLLAELTSCLVFPACKMGPQNPVLYREELVDRGRGFTELVKGWPSFPSLLGTVVTVPRISSNARAAQPRAFAHAAPSHPRVPAPADAASPGFLSPSQSRGASGREG